jgi:ATP-dependent DNA ligase
MGVRARYGHGQSYSGLDWTDKYPSDVATLANLSVKTAYLDGEL